ncbi:MAG: CHAT domain-containing protein [Snowella sp.]|nr:CHAT domain-containing protein [Snowella sp.]
MLPLLFAPVTGSMPLSQASTTELITQGKTFYQNQQFEQAKNTWEKTAQLFANQGDRLNQAMALSNLALAQQQLGQWQAANQTIFQSLNLLENQPQTPEQQRILAATFDIQAQGQLATGQAEAAVNTWQQTIQLNDAIANPVGVMQSRINQAQAWQDLGQYPKACQGLLTALDLKASECQISPAQLENLPLSPSDSLQILGLRSLGNVLRMTGQTEQSQQVLLKALDLAQNIALKNEISQIYLSLGNTARALGNKNSTTQSKLVPPEGVSCVPNQPQNEKFPYYQQAASCYQQAISQASPFNTVKAEINLLALLTQTEQWKEIPTLIPNIQSDLAKLPVNQASLTSQLKLTQELLCLQLLKSTPTLQRGQLAALSPVMQQCPAFQKITQIKNQEDRQPSQSPPLTRTVQFLNTEALASATLPSFQEIEQNTMQVFRQAQQLGDRRNEADALGYLGAIAQQKGDYPQAENYTKQALQRLSAYYFPASAYRWQWQLGRLYRLQNQADSAINAYNLAYQTLQSLRQEIVTTNPDIQYTFRDGVEPVYREYVDLLLQPENPDQETLKKARDIIESLQLAELNNFFQEACLEAQPQQIDQIDPQAAVIYGIVLPERLAVILSVPNQPLRYYATAQSSPSAQGGAIAIEQTVDQLFASLNPFIASLDPLEPKRNLYNWLIRPAEADLAKSQVKTLVFVLDGALRGIPVAALHDGKQYLVEKYNLALTPGLQLLSARSLSLKQSTVLVGGLTEARLGFDPLPSVEKEVKEIASLASAKVLLNETFTRDRLESQMQRQDQDFPIVHLATHGQFSSQADQTFLITWDKRINVKDLDTLLREQNQLTRNPIELLILSACQTAVGDKRAALGLAGVAVRSGARSTVATLWAIQDQSTADFMTEFYQAISNPETSKADALRQAQLALLRSPQYQHPYYWAPFVLIGNWI